MFPFIILFFIFSHFILFSHLEKITAKHIIYVGGIEPHSHASSFRALQMLHLWKKLHALEEDQAYALRIPYPIITLSSNKNEKINN